MPKRMPSTRVAALYLLLSTTALTPAQAQTAPNPASPAAPPTTAVDQPTPAASPEAPSSGIGEIVVTAQRRAEKLNNVGISVVAATGDQLTTRGVRTTEDLVKIVPGLTAAPTPYGNTVLTLRGVGFYESSLSGTSPVAAYIDEIPIPYTRMTNGASLDLQRVEVLKGPQGTLYGQNSTGGAINYIANKPTDDWHAGLDASLGRFFDTDVQGFVSGPITDTLTFRVAARSHQSDDWQQSVTRDDTLGATRFLTGRVLLAWNPTARLRFELNLNGFRDRSDDPAVAATSFQPNNPAAIQPAELTARLTPPGNDRLADWDADKRFRRNNWDWQAALKSTYAVTDRADIIAITSYQQFKEDQLLDTDGTDAEANTVRQRGRIRSFSQELRLQGSAGELKYVAGGNYSHDIIYEENLFIVADGSQGHGVPGLPWRYTHDYSTQHADTYAAFANADYMVLPGLDLQGGVRYTKQDRDFSGCLGDPYPLGDGEWARLFSYLLGATIPNGACTTLNTQTGVIGLVTQKNSEDNVSWRAAVNYKPSTDTLLYASVSRGYKQGSYPTVGGSVASQFDHVKQESLLAYEVGTKLTLLDRKLQLNAAGYYYDYSDKQLRGKITVPQLGTIEELFNIPKSRVYGAELQVVAAPVRGFNLQGNVTYANSRVQSDFPNLSPIGKPINLQGESFELTPKWSANASIDYDQPISGELNGFVGADMNFLSRQHGGYGGDPLFTIDPYALVDLRVGIRTASDRWRAQLYVRNVANKYYWTNANYLGEFTYRQLGFPRTYGIQVSYRY